MRSGAGLNGHNGIASPLRVVAAFLFVAVLGLAAHQPALGLGLPQDHAATMVDSLRSAAEQGDAGGQYRLGVMYYFGNGVTQNYAEAVRWYRLAAEQGYVGGQYGLGLMYDFGNGVTQNYAEAVRWYRLAAEQGDAEGQYELGSMYYLGNGVPQDYVQAHKWVNLSIARSRPDNHFRDRRDRWVNLRREIESKMTREQVAEAQRLAREWRPTEARRQPS